MSSTLFTRELVRLLLVNMAFHFGFSTFWLLPKFMAQELAATPSEIGAITTAFGISMIASVPLVGRSLDAYGNRGVLKLGCVLSTLACFGYLGVDRMGPLLLLLRCAQGVSLSMFVSAGSILSADYAPPGRLAQSIGLFAASGMIMTALAPSLAEWLSQLHGYAPTFLLASVSGVLALLLVRSVHDQPQGHIAQASLRLLLCRGTSLRMMAVLGAAGLGFGAMFAFSVPFSLELGIANVRGFFLAFTGGALFVRLCLGRLIDHLGHRRMATCALWTYASTVGAMYLLTPARLPLFGALFGLSHGLFIPAFTAFIVSNVALHERSKLMTLFHAAFNLGNCLVFALGIGVEHYGYRTMFAATGALVLAAPLLLLGWPEASTSEAHATNPKGAI